MMGYASGALGNHDLDNGPAAWIRTAREAKFPVRSANVFVAAESSWARGREEVPSAVRRGAKWVGGPQGARLGEARVPHRETMGDRRACRAGARRRLLRTHNPGSRAARPAEPERRGRGGRSDRGGALPGASAPEGGFPGDLPLPHGRGHGPETRGARAGDRRDRRRPQPHAAPHAGARSKHHTERGRGHRDRAGGTSRRVSRAARALRGGRALEGILGAAAARGPRKQARTRGSRRCFGPTPRRSPRRRAAWCSTRRRVFLRAGSETERRRSGTSSRTSCAGPPTRTSGSSTPAEFAPRCPPER